MPLVSFAKETSLLFAGLLLFSYLPARPHAKNSSLLTLVAYTLRNQIAFQNVFTWFFWEDRLLWLGDATIARFPSSFFGMGNETDKADEERYTPFVVRAFGALALRTFDNFYAGLSYDFRYNQVLQRAIFGRLANDGIPGDRGSTNIGVGLTALYDSRDNTIHPRRGQRVEYFTRYYSEALGSTTSFTRHFFDVRSYHDLSYDHVLAWRAQLELLTAKPPYNIRPFLGGRQLLRGVFEGRYVDRNAAIAQVEYRSPPLWWRLGATAFADLGQVAAQFGDFALRRFHPSGGAGLRALFSEDARIWARLDAGVSADDWGIYFSLGEPF